MRKLHERWRQLELLKEEFKAKFKASNPILTDLTMWCLEHEYEGRPDFINLENQIRKMEYNLENQAFISELIPIESNNHVAIDPQQGTGFFPRAKQDRFEVLGTDEFSYPPKKEPEPEPEPEPEEEEKAEEKEGHDEGEEENEDNNNAEEEAGREEVGAEADAEEQKSQHMKSYLKTQAITPIHYSMGAEEIAEMDIEFPEEPESEIIVEIEESVQSVQGPKKNKEKIFGDSQDNFYRPKWEIQMENTLNFQEKQAFISKSHSRPSEYQKMFGTVEDKETQPSKKK